MDRKLDARASCALSFIRHEVDAGRGMPTREALRAHLGYARRGSADDVLRDLVSLGLLEESRYLQGKLWRRTYKLMGYA